MQVPAHHQITRLLAIQRPERNLLTLDLGHAVVQSDAISNIGTREHAHKARCQQPGITQFQSGVNLQENANVNFNLSVPSGTLPDGSSLTNVTVAGTNSLTLMPVLTCNPNQGLHDHQFINASCFALPSPGHNGPIVEPEMFGPAFFNSDLSLFKNFNFSESRRLQFRFSGYNFLSMYCHQCRRRFSPTPSPLPAPSWTLPDMWGTL